MGWLGEYLLELVFPTSCAGCGEYGGELVCGDCRDRLALLQGPRCRRCARPTFYEVDVCAECLLRRPAFDGAYAAGLYRDPLRAIIHRLKYRNGRRLVPYLADLMGEALRQGAPASGATQAACAAGGDMYAWRAQTAAEGAFDVVTFVPMHRRKQKERGYNQAELLAKEVARGLGLEAAPLLRRTRSGAAQTGLALRARRENVRGAFEAREEGLSGRTHVLLVDDVMTSGFTLSECARSLKRAGAGRVTCCVLARDVPGGLAPGTG